jgi:hypothetical protein
MPPSVCRLEYGLILTLFDESGEGWRLHEDGWSLGTAHGGRTGGGWRHVVA